MSLVAVEDVRLTLGRGDQRVHVLNGVDFTLDRGETVGLVGRSGSGKSTLLMVLAGLERPDTGRIAIDGSDVTGMSEADLTDFRGRTIGIVFQSFHLIPTMTALENVSIPAELAGFGDARDRASDMLDRVGLAQRLGHYPRELSGGEQQRVAIARALVGEPKLILADEPTGNLDNTTGEGIMDLLFEMRAQFGQTLLLITHDLALAARCDRMLSMRDGLIEPDAALLTAEAHAPQVSA